MDKILPTPEGFDIKESGNGIVVISRWYKPMVWFFIFFAVLWNGFLVFWMSAPTPLFFKLFALIHVGVGIGLVWYIVCLFVNKTEIAITSQDFAIRHSPIPFPTYKNSHLKRKDIDQVFIKQDISRGKNGTTITYSVNVFAPQGKSTKVLSFDGYEKAILSNEK